MVWGVGLLFRRPSERAQRPPPGLGGTKGRASESRPEIRHTSGSGSSPPRKERIWYHQQGVAPVSPEILVHARWYHPWSEALRTKLPTLFGESPVHARDVVAPEFAKKDGRRLRSLQYEMKYVHAAATRNSEHGSL